MIKGRGSTSVDIPLTVSTVSYSCASIQISTPIDISLTVSTNKTAGQINRSTSVDISLYSLNHAASTSLLSGSTPVDNFVHSFNMQMPELHMQNE